MRNYAALRISDDMTADASLFGETARIEFFQAAILAKTSHHHKKVVTIKKRDGTSFTKLADRPELLSARNQLDTIFMEHQPERLICGPIRLEIELTWPWNAGDSRKVRARGRIPHAGRPDLDNSAKGITDALVRCAYMPQDSAVVELVMRKFRGDRPGIRVVIEQIA
jgi:Holliday junction resolvase RusA-like endonuclease